jgi:hypothetical protein
MSTLTNMRVTAALVATAVLLLVVLSATPAEASTLYACVKKNGTARIFTKKPKCRKGDTRVSWNTAGPLGKTGGAGKAGATGKTGAAGKTGATGAGGAPGQPQEAAKFSASLGTGEAPTTLFSAGGITYTLSCNAVASLNVGAVDAGGTSAQSYGQASFGRPSGQEANPEDLKSEALVQTLGNASAPIATTADATENTAKSIEQFGVWSVTVEGPTSVTWLHVWMETGSSCGVHGTAITVPD